MVFLESTPGNLGGFALLLDGRTVRRASVPGFEPLPDLRRAGPGARTVLCGPFFFLQFVLPTQNEGLAFGAPRRQPK